MSLLAVGVTAGGTVFAADAFLHRLHAPVHQREVADAVRDYESADPTTLVLWSSHARTFVAVGEAVAERTGGRERILAVPVEWGKYTSYRWVLEHRLAPLIDERGPDGQRSRKSLRRFVLLTAWWAASKLPTDLPNANLPSRAWQLGDFLADVRRSGINDYNRNYVAYRFRDLGYDSVLVNDRGLGRLPIAVRDWLRAPSDAELEERFARQVARSHAIVAAGAAGVAHPDEMRALGDILDFAAARDLEITVALYPIPPASYDATLYRDTIEPSNRAICAYVAKRGLPCIDGTTAVGAENGDFMADLDHLNARGNAKFTRWALGGPLAFLLEPRR